MTQQIRQRRKQQSRSRLVAEARSICAERGLVALSTADVARRSGMSHGSVFTHFKKRENLLLEVLGSFAQELTDDLHRLIDTDASLRQVLEAHVQAVEEREDLYYQILVDHPRLGSSFQAAWVGIQSAISNYLQQAVDLDIKNGTIKPLDPSLLFNTWLALLHHYILNRKLFEPNGSVLERHGKKLIEHYVQLIDQQEDKND